MLLGGQSFAWVNAIRSFILLSFEPVRMNFPSRDLRQMKSQLPDHIDLDNLLMGANYALSTLAIYNIIRFEHSLRENLQELLPCWKFYGAKILAPMAFLQS